MHAWMCVCVCIYQGNLRQGNQEWVPRGKCVGLGAVGGEDAAGGGERIYYKKKSRVVLAFKFLISSH